MTIKLLKNVHNRQVEKALETLANCSKSHMRKSEDKNRGFRKKTFQARLYKLFIKLLATQMFLSG